MSMLPRYLVKTQEHKTKNAHWCSLPKFKAYFHSGCMGRKRNSLQQDNEYALNFSM